MGKLGFGRRHGLCMAAVFLIVLLFAAGCGGKETAEDKVRDLEFTLVGQNDLPQELREIIEEKKKEPFRLTFSNGADLYIAAGYGEQESGGYSIAVPELYLAENSIVVRTELQGPEQGEAAGTGASYPFAVMRTELIEKPVVFR